MNFLINLFVHAKYKISQNFLLVACIWDIDVYCSPIYWPWCLYMKDTWGYLYMAYLLLLASYPCILYIDPNKVDYMYYYALWIRFPTVELILKILVGVFLVQSTYLIFDQSSLWFVLFMVNSCKFTIKIRDSRHEDYCDYSDCEIV
jgi:hypothetical protein